MARHCFGEKTGDTRQHHLAVPWLLRDGVTPVTGPGFGCDDRRTQNAERRTGRAGGSGKKTHNGLAVNVNGTRYWPAGALLLLPGWLPFNSLARPPKIR